MSYRGTEGFTWSADDRSRSTRVVAAIALIVAGWVFGFFSGRMSAWVFPVANPDVAALTASLKSAHPQPTITQEVTAPRVEEKQERPSLALSPAASQPDRSSSKSQDTPPEARDTSPVPPEAEQPDTKADPSPRGAVLVNPDWTAPSAPKEREKQATISERQSLDGNAIAECERRYSSFRASDGTYQPYGRSTRVRCPLLQ